MEPKQQKQSRERKTKPVSYFLISKHLTKLQKSEQYGTGIKIRHTDQWNTSDNQEINPYIYGQMSFVTGAKATQWGKESLSHKWYCENWISIRKRMKLDLYILYYIKKKKVNS